MHIWYVGYGSNLFHERFLCYINGKPFRWGGSPPRGCVDKTTPIGRSIMIPHELYFAKKSNSWGGGVAFISTKKDETAQTYGKMWKITSEQFLEIWDQEGTGWYNTALYLGKDEDGIPILTITNSERLTSKQPATNYVKTIAAGLREAHQLSDEAVCDYLISKDGVKGAFTQQDIFAICQSI